MEDIKTYLDEGEHNSSWSNDWKDPDSLGETMVKFMFTTIVIAALNSSEKFGMVIKPRSLNQVTSRYLPTTRHLPKQS